jgi:prevent-host-death family protein
VEQTITAAKASESFSHLLKKIRAGNSYLITIDGSPAARLIPIKQMRRRRMRTSRRDVQRREKSYLRALLRSTP